MTKGCSKRDVQVVFCPPSNPWHRRAGETNRNSTSASARRSNRKPSDNQQTPAHHAERSQEEHRKGTSILLDFDDTAREIRHYGATAFQGSSKRHYEEEQYELLTGRKKKRQKVPLPILRGIRRKRRERERRQDEEARAVGVVVASRTKKKTRENADQRQRRIHGPAPSVGFIKGGILSVTSNTKSKR